MLYPKDGLRAILRRQPERASEVFETLGLITGHELRGKGRVYGGGLHKIEPRELGRVNAEDFIKRWPELGDTLQCQHDLELFPG